MIDLNTRLNEAYDIVYENLEKAREINKEYYDKKIVQRKFEIGDICYVSNPVLKYDKDVTKSLYNKRWNGPYLIRNIRNTNVYLKDLLNNKDIPRPVSIRRIKIGYLYKGKYSISNIDQDPKVMGKGSADKLLAVSTHLALRASL